jgi:hypothetical protein
MTQQHELDEVHCARCGFRFEVAPDTVCHDDVVRCARCFGGDVAKRTVTGRIRMVPGDPPDPAYVEHVLAHVVCFAGDLTPDRAIGWMREYLPVLCGEVARLRRRVADLESRSNPFGHFSRMAERAAEPESQAGVAPQASRPSGQGACAPVDERDKRG